MKFLKKTIIFIFCVMLITGCGRQNKTSIAVQNTNTVDNVINEQIDEETQTTETETDSENNISATEEAASDYGLLSSDEGGANGVDYDLTQMGSDMVYATVYQMMSSPAQYEGKTFRIEGDFYAVYYEPTAKYYFYCIIQDATACCAQGMEFVWDDGSHIYPDEYPEENATVVVEGTFETYREEGDTNLYCRLKDAELTIP